METRPKLKIPKSTPEKLANIVGYSVFIGSAVYVTLTFASLSDNIPMQFGPGGEVNRYGSPYELLILVAIQLFLIIFMEILERIPHVHNYPARINEENIEAFYLNSRQIVNFSKNGVMLIFAFVFIEIIGYGLTGETSFGIYLLPLILVISLAPVVWGLNERRKIR
ncbi:DUF1648 domain-containing protein [Lacicoccus qingdaonensis]|uniref:DUF1648 domain-containing protein n=1 Tax=Lacicoccus qingdaonensis TaxID=576118 RepID=A0A1G9HBU6_9BACL|nr:DUF1648 domain-containing protein [Salinicoccus qingdaonensis]SDL09953.1 Protein of unknown function [Salinicoccus qingdaonensis]